MKMSTKEIITLGAVLISVWVFSAITGLFFPSKWMLEWYGFPWLLTGVMVTMAVGFKTYEYLKAK